MGKLLTTDDLVNTSLRRAMIPSDNPTFTTSDIRDIMNEEFGSYMLPMVIRTHEEYSVIDEDIPLSSSTSKYRIPYRAVGSKLRDVQFLDTGGGYYEATRLTIEDRPDSQHGYSSSSFIQYYIQDDSVVLMNTQSSNGCVRMSYYLRPNELVADNRAGVVTAISNEFGDITISSYADLISGTVDTFTIAGTVFSAQSGAASLGDATFQATTDNDTTAVSLSAQINGHATVSELVTASIVDNVVTIIADASSYDMPSLVYSDNDSNSGASVSVTKQTFTVSSYPSHFSTTTVYDFVQANSPNKILGFDRNVLSTDSSALTITFDVTELTTPSPIRITPDRLTLSIGDHIMKKEESIIPQLPAELHPLLAQRTAIKMLEALGDTEGMKNAQGELDRMEYNVQTLIDNRAEGSPQKVRNNNSLLRSSVRKSGFRRGF